ncbi:MAG: sodium:proton antiporter [Pseudopedobacter saltans]|uniref:Sodium:proton antiporter n=1 Tax=Pseudopedobacter saltans TaxID=151895 RepID=A0A2W5F6N8_9SPHI|nr:MAG: sodium:proton antiporter [Pseudopedobacter saltans]
MELYYSLSILIVLAALFSYINARFLKLPPSIGVMIIALLMSLVLVFWGIEFPKTVEHFTKLVTTFDLPDILMNVMLNFLLFAGGIHIRFKDLRAQKGPVIIMSTVGVIISTILVGYGLYFVSNLMHLSFPLIQCMVFGALISPTDPIAVMGILKQAGVSKSLETKVTGESLFNDGVAVVLFMTINSFASGEEVDTSFKGISFLLIQEIVGGVGLGVLLGFLATMLIKRVNEYMVEVLITLAVVMGGSLLATSLHFSAPLTMVAAGLFVGNISTKYSSSESKDYLAKFWHIIDELLNYILFILIGFELLIIPHVGMYAKVGIVAIVIVLLARLISIYIPSRIASFRRVFDMNTVFLLTWGGLRGGVSIALAISMFESPNKPAFVAITYIVVLFSIIVQGLTVGKFAKKLTLRPN